MRDFHIMRINSIREIDLDTITLSDIRWKYGTGISTDTGSRKAGTYKPGYRTGVMTDIGDIQIDIWRQAAEHIARRDGEVWLVDALMAWEKASNYGKKSQGELYLHTLLLYSHRMFDNQTWVDFIPFNRTYRAGALKQAQIVTVVNSCCGKAGEVTQKQIDHAYSGKICCPHCGRWSTFFAVAGRSSLPWEEGRIGDFQT